jgi:hypothetical protein
MQAVVDAHETPPKLLLVAPLGVAPVCVLHDVPFQRSISSVALLFTSYCEPTAVHAPLDGHETPARPFPFVPGSVVVWSDHVAADAAAGVTSSPPTSTASRPLLKLLMRFPLLDAGI